VFPGQIEAALTALLIQTRVFSDGDQLAVRPGPPRSAAAGPAPLRGAA